MIERRGAAGGVKADGQGHALIAGRVRSRGGAARAAEEGAQRGGDGELGPSQAVGVVEIDHLLGAEAGAVATARIEAGAAISKVCRTIGNTVSKQQQVEQRVFGLLQECGRPRSDQISERVSNFIQKA